MAAPKTVLFSGLKTSLKAITGIKHVALWNNQIERENVEQAFLYPAVFIEFIPSEFKDELNKVQLIEMTVRLHICFETYKDEDIAIFDLTQSVYSAIHYNQYGNWDKVKRRNEEQNFDHPNVQIFIQDYETRGRDYDADSRPTTSATVDPDVTGVIVEIEDNL
jgi:hypothetical protein